MAASLGAVDLDWRIIPLLILVWYFLLKRWERAGVLDRWNATRVFGFVLMVRTKKGLDVLEKMAKPRRFWRIYGEVSLWVCTFAMFMVALVVLLAFVSAIPPNNNNSTNDANRFVAGPAANMRWRSRLGARNNSSPSGSANAPSGSGPNCKRPNDRMRIP